MNKNILRLVVRIHCIMDTIPMAHQIPTLKRELRNHQPNKTKDAKVLSMAEENEDTGKVWSQFKDFNMYSWLPWKVNKPRAPALASEPIEECTHIRKKFCVTFSAP